MVLAKAKAYHVLTTIHCSRYTCGLSDRTHVPQPNSNSFCRGRKKHKARLLLIAESSVFVFCFSNEKTAVYKQLSQNKKERRCTNWKRSFCDQILDNTSQHLQRTQQDSSARSPMPTVSTSGSRESLRNRGESCNEKTKNRQSNHSTPPHNDRDKSHTSPINENHAFRKFSKIYLYTKKWTENK